MSERDTHARAVDEGRVDLLRVLGARVLGEYLTAAFGAQSTVPDYTEHEWLKPLPEATRKRLTEGTWDVGEDA